MGNLDFSANADQLKELAAYMASQINVPTIGIGGGYAPIGTIISVMGTTAPQDYLACDGTVYNIADYPQLADYFESQFGESNHFGGDGATTFAVPDLQGEFLRGTGTNSHTNQGSGANVGEHQDGTLMPYTNGASVIAVSSQAVDSTSDYMSSLGATTRRNVTGSQDNSGSVFTSRPTNTSVLYCIKAVVAGEVYSTEERVVGTWIDGKKIYQKSYSFNSPINLQSNAWVMLDSALTNTDTMIFSSASNDGGQYIPIYTAKNNGIRMLQTRNTDVNVNYVTLQYTKTTD